MTTYEGAEVQTFPWWLVLLEGIFAALFGLLLLIAPGATWIFLIQVLGFYLLIGGIFRIVSMFLDTSSWGWKLVGGVIGIIAGIVVLQHPLWGAIVVPVWFIFLIGFLAVVQGILGVVLAFQGGGWGAGILGAMGFIFGLVLVANPFIGVGALPFVLGAFMLIGGIVAIMAAFRMRSRPAAVGG